MKISQKNKENAQQLEELINKTIDNAMAQTEREFLSLIKKEDYIEFVRDLFYFCEGENAKERTYRESFERHPNDFIKYGVIQNSFGKSDAYEQVYYKIKHFLKGDKK